MNIKRSAWLVAAFAMLASCAYGAWAPEEIVVAGRNETVTLNVPDQDVESVPGNVFIGSGGALHKTGGGLLTMPLEKFVQGTEVTVGVREGAVRIAAFDPENFNFSEPYDTLEKAALWLDASADGKVLYTSSNDVDWVDGWLDVRETGNETDGYEYLRALTNLDPANLAPTLVETNGVKAVWFGGYKSGRSLNWCDAAGAIRVMPPCMATGEAAGTAAALSAGCGGSVTAGAKKRFTPAPEADVDLLRTLLRSHGARVD